MPPQLVAYLLAVFDEVEEDDVLAPEADGGVQRVFRLALEHRVEQRRSHVRKVGRSEVVLGEKFFLLFQM